MRVIEVNSNLLLENNAYTVKRTKFITKAKNQGETFLDILLAALKRGKK